jgi:hypothetical protein
MVVLLPGSIACLGRYSLGGCDDGWTMAAEHESPDGNDDLDLMTNLYPAPPGCRW